MDERVIDERVAYYLHSQATSSARVSIQRMVNKYISFSGVSIRNLAGKQNDLTGEIKQAKVVLQDAVQKGVTSEYRSKIK